VARRLVGCEAPFAILPLGTANNLATKLGWAGPLEEVVERLADARPQPFDVGLARGPWGTHRFIEGVGMGPFARAMAFLDAEWDDIVHEPNKPKKELARDARLLRAFLHESIPRRWQVTVDGEPVEGPFVLVEIQNTGLIGPNLRIAPDAEVADGRFDVVLVGDADRQALAAYIDRVLDGDETPPILPTRRTRHVHLAVEATRIHIDDEVWPDSETPPPPLDAPFEVDIRVEPGALTALVPE